MEPGQSKVDGVRKACQILGIDISEVVAIGDSDNDVKMLSQCGYGIAVGSAAGPAKKAADHVSRASYIPLASSRGWPGWGCSIPRTGIRVHADRDDDQRHLNQTSAGQNFIRSRLQIFSHAPDRPMLHLWTPGRLHLLICGQMVCEKHYDTRRRCARTTALRQEQGKKEKY